jgi:hypothetical protein
MVVRECNNKTQPTNLTAKEGLSVHYWKIHKVGLDTCAVSIVSSFNAF